MNGEGASGRWRTAGRGQPRELASRAAGRAGSQGQPGIRARSAPEIPRFPVDPWCLREQGFDPLLAAGRETIFSLGNGHLGVRGTLEEEAGNVTRGTYVNGFYETVPIRYGETAYGYARNHQVMLNVADGTLIQLYVDQEPLDLTTGRVEASKRSLDMRSGVLERTVRWRSPAGHLVEVSSRRIVCLARPSVAAIEYDATILEGRGTLRIASAIDVRARPGATTGDPRVGHPVPEGSLTSIRREVNGPQGAVIQRTRGTGLTIAVAMDHAISAIGPLAGKPNSASRATADRVTFEVSAEASSGTGLRLRKILAYTTSLDLGADDPLARARADAEAAGALGFKGLLAEQRAELDRFWSVADVEVDGDPGVQQALRFSLFSLFQAAGRDGRTSIPAKGLTGEGYEGHYFWDTEVFALPLFAYTRPEIARALLQYRVRTLDKARERAIEMRQRGALYAWRTIGGEEASAYFPAGTAQYHIDADIAVAFEKYVHATGDRTILTEGGAEVVFETARLWADLGAYIPAQANAFCINEVTGPDEYTALVNNNCYTNLMARANLRYAVALAERMSQDDPSFYRELAARIGLDEDEVVLWRRAAERMRVPRDEALGIHVQDDTFLTREVWDFAGTPRAEYPLLLHVHPLVIYRYQVLKQPDVVLAQVLLGAEFTPAEKKRNFDYYDPLTTGNSSLSPCIQSVAAAELGYGDLAYAYFQRTVRMDLDDVNGNVADGIHLAAMAGSWIAVVFGFAGFRDDGGRTDFAPRPPDPWRRLRFRMLIRGSLLLVTITSRHVVYELLSGPDLAIRHFGRAVVLRAGRPMKRSLERPAGQIRAPLPPGEP